jgi:hypothetical protein
MEIAHARQPPPPLLQLLLLLLLLPCSAPKCQLPPFVVEQISERLKRYSHLFEPKLCFEMSVFRF